MNCLVSLAVQVKHCLLLAVDEYFCIGTRSAIVSKTYTYSTYQHMALSFQNWQPFIFGVKAILMLLHSQNSPIVLVICLHISTPHALLGHFHPTSPPKNILSHKLPTRRSHYANTAGTTSAQGCFHDLIIIMFAYRLSPACFKISTTNEAGENVVIAPIKNYKKYALTLIKLSYTPLKTTSILNHHSNKPKDLDIQVLCMLTTMLEPHSFSLSFSRYAQRPYEDLAETIYVLLQLLCHRKIALHWEIQYVLDKKYTLNKLWKGAYFTCLSK